MSDAPTEQPEDSREPQEPLNEAAERQMRLQVWLNGLLEGGPSLADAVKPWREGLPIYARSGQTLAEDQNEVPDDNEELVSAWVMAACRRIRERREQSGEPPLEIHEDEKRRRLAEVLETVKAGRRAGKEFTPLDTVLAARYVEGMISPEEYRSQK